MDFLASHTCIISDCREPGSVLVPEPSIPINTESFGVSSGGCCWIQAIQVLPQASEVEGERGIPNALEPGSRRGGNHGIGIPDRVLALFHVRPLVVNTGEPSFSLLQCAIMSDCYFP